MAGAGAFALTNYMELGAGVLILWYGGDLVMDTAFQSLKSGVAGGKYIPRRSIISRLTDAKDSSTRKNTRKVQHTNTQTTQLQQTQQNKQSKAGGAPCQGTTAR